MEHIMEWHLVMRDESDMLRLAPDPESAKIYTDETGINVFLEIVKPIT
jgi:extracellular factor (EF) 3-hydroxypalmitic acid methyl ester biosynthesis protein